MELVEVGGVIVSGVMTLADAGADFISTHTVVTDVIVDGVVDVIVDGVGIVFSRGRGRSRNRNRSV